VERSTSLGSEIYKEPFWWNLFGTKQMEKEAKSSEMSTQTKLTSRYLKKNTWWRSKYLSYTKDFKGFS